LAKSKDKRAIRLPTSAYQRRALERIARNERSQNSSSTEGDLKASIREYLQSKKTRKALVLPEKLDEKLEERLQYYLSEGEQLDAPVEPRAAKDRNLTRKALGLPPIKDEKTKAAPRDKAEQPRHETQPRDESGRWVTDESTGDMTYEQPQEVES
jgi:hypothetical protein